MKLQLLRWVSSSSILLLRPVVLVSWTPGGVLQEGIVITDKAAQLFGYGWECTLGGLAHLGFYL